MSNFGDDGCRSQSQVSMKEQDFQVAGACAAVLRSDLLQLLHQRDKEVLTDMAKCFKLA